MGTVIIDNTDRVLLNINKVKDRSLHVAANDIEVIVKTGGKTPLGPAGKDKSRARLRGLTRQEKVSESHYRVVLPVAWASYQERGMRADGSHVVRKYTEPGTGKGFLQAAINTVGKNFTNLVKQAAKMEGF
jgi:hypothetical protein